jgi:hypothetical protein
MLCTTTRARTTPEVYSEARSRISARLPNSCLQELTSARASCRSSSVVETLKPLGRISLIQVAPGQAVESVESSAILHIHFPHPNASRFWAASRLLSQEEPRVKMGRTGTEGAQCSPLTVERACAMFGESSAVRLQYHSSQLK